MLPLEHIQAIKAYGAFETGSTVFGGMDPYKTDVYLVIPCDDLDRQHQSYLDEKYGIYEGDYRGEGIGLFSMYVMGSNALVYNFLFMHRERAEEFKMATDFMIKEFNSSTYYREMAADKHKRIETFHRHRDHAEYIIKNTKQSQELLDMCDNLGF